MEELRFQTKSGPRNILVAVDSSEHSFEAVRYVGRILPAKGNRITLFHVLDPVPEFLWDIESTPCFHDQVLDCRTFQAQQKRVMQDFMDRATSLLINQGHQQKDVYVFIEDRDVGIARDIARKAQNGFDALVLGRRGMSEVRDLILGSIAHKLVSHLIHTTVWVVGAQPDHTRILIAMDSSAGAGRALDYVCELFGREHPEILLLHVTRGIRLFKSGSDVGTPGVNLLDQAREELRKAEKVMAGIFEECIGRMEQRGADVSRIKTKIVPGVHSRAAAIYGEAREEGCDTIVVGRRGLSRVEEFFMGSVSNKVLQLCGDMAVWIVH